MESFPHVPVDKKKKTSSTKTKKSTSESKTVIKSAKRFNSASKLFTFTNPTYGDQDLEYFEDAWANTPAGTAIDKKAEFVIGGGIIPTLEIINDDGLTDEQKQNVLKEYDDLLNEIKDIDRDVKLKQNIFDAYVMSKVFGRAAILFEDNVDGENSKGIPRSLKLPHSRDLGRPEIDEEDWSLKFLRVNNPGADVEPDDMIYLVNKSNSPIRRTMHYGFSDMQRIVGPARAYRRITEFDMPEMATTMWAGYQLIMLKKLGRSTSGATTDATNIANSLNAGTFNIIEVDAMDDIDAKSLDLNPKITEMVEMASFYERTMIGNFQVPSALLGREEDQNRATLIGKIRFFIEGPVEADREWLGDILAKQWYEHLIKVLGHEDILEEIRVKVEFEQIFTESYDDLVDAVGKLQNIVNISDEKKLELLNLEEAKNDIEDRPEVDSEQEGKAASSKTAV